MRPVGVVVPDPAGKAGAAFRSCLECVQIDAFVFERSPQAFDKHIVHPAPASIHADADVRVLQRRRESKAGELAALVRV